MGFIPWWITRWRFEPPLWGLSYLPWVGGVLAALGLVILVDSFARFALQGLGTPAPIMPTQHLVVSGAYRFVRNPMYVAGLALIVGQALLFGDARLLAYVAIVWVVTHLFVVLYEEPTMRRTFGSEYDAFARAVPRWIPRLKPWRGPA